MLKFYVHVPGWAHSMTACGHDERDARDRFRKQHGMLRLPKGTKFWIDDTPFVW
jgi:hypothetical protein